MRINRTMRHERLIELSYSAVEPVLMDSAAWHGLPAHAHRPTAHARLRYLLDLPALARTVHRFEHLHVRQPLFAGRRRLLVVLHAVREIIHLRREMVHRLELHVLGLSTLVDAQ